MYSKSIARASGTAMPHQSYLQVSTAVAIPSSTTEQELNSRSIARLRKAASPHYMARLPETLAFPWNSVIATEKVTKRTLSLLKKKLLYLLSFGRVFVFVQSSRDISLTCEEGSKLLAGPKLQDQAVLPKALLWETAFYDVAQSAYLMLMRIPLQARYFVEAWNGDWNHQFWVTKTDSCTVCTCNPKGVELQVLPSTGWAHLPSLPHPKLQKGRKQKLRTPVANAANGFDFLEGQAPVWRLKLVALRRCLLCWPCVRKVMQRFSQAHTPRLQGKTFATCLCSVALACEGFFLKTFGPEVEIWLVASLFGWTAGSVEESYMCFPQCRLWSLCMGICGARHGCQQPDPKKCPTPWKLEKYTRTQTLGWAKAARPGCSSKGTSLGNSFLWRGAVCIFDVNADTFASQVLCRSLKWWLKPSILGHKDRLMHRLYL